MFTATLISLLTVFTPAVRAQVTATNPNGATNPAAPSFAAAGSTVNQTSFSRLLSLNGVDDFCLYGPPEPGAASLIGNVEPIVVAYCTKPRNGARIIPDGTIQSAKFIKTPLYVQISGFYDGTKINVPYGDTGGELDPHGAENLGNPIGGNVTSDVSGKDVFYEEWMSFISYDQYCLRVCTAQSANVTAALQCEHTLDVMGCNFVMALGPDVYQTNGTFVSCDGEPAAPPGLYVNGGTTSTFRQRYTGTYTDGAGAAQTFTVGDLTTPSAPAFIPQTSNCVSYTSISNGINTANYVVSSAVAPLTGGTTGSLPPLSAAPTTSATASASNSRVTSSGAALTGTSAAASGASAAASTKASSAQSVSGGFSSLGAVLLGGFGFGAVLIL